MQRLLSGARRSANPAFPTPPHGPPKDQATLVARNRFLLDEFHPATARNPKESQRYFGTDLTLIDGIGPGVIVSLMSEIGSREHLLTSFKSADGFCAWLGLYPCNAIRGGKVLRSATRKVRNRLSEALRLVASYDESQAFPVKPATRQKQLRQLQSLAKKLNLQVLLNPTVITS